MSVSDESENYPSKGGSRTRNTDLCDNSKWNEESDEPRRTFLSIENSNNTLNR